MSAIPKVMSEEKIASQINYTSIITDPIAPKHISKTNTCKLTMSSVIKAGMVSSAALALYYLAKTTNIFSYFGWGVKDLNSKDAGNGEISKIKNKANALTVRRDLETTSQINGLSVNQIAKTHKGNGETVEFEEIKIEEFKDLNEVEEKNVGKRRSISIKNPIPNQYIDIGLSFNLTIDGSSVFSSNSALFLKATNIPTWLTSTNPDPGLEGWCDIYQPNKVAIFGDFAYVTKDSGLQIIDISDPSNPTFKGSCDTLDVAYEVAVSGNYAYVTGSSTAFLQIIDITNPSKPILKGRYDKIGKILEIIVFDNYAYLADLKYGLQIIDITNSSNPIFKGSYDIGSGAHGIALSENYAYMTGDPGLLIIDITNLTKPTLKGSYSIPGLTSRIALFENFVCVVNDITPYPYSSSLKIIDISTPSKPTLKGSYDSLGDPYGITISGNYAYVADGGLWIIDVSDPANPTFKNTYYISAYSKATGIALFDNYAYMADRYYDSLEIIAPNLDKLKLSGVPNYPGIYRVNIKACNEAKECATDSFDIIVTDLVTTSIIIGLIICATGSYYICCCSITGIAILTGGGIMALKQYHNKDKKSIIPINQKKEEKPQKPNVKTPLLLEKE